MGKIALISMLLATMVTSGCSHKPAGKHLFILSGQSNMAGLDIDLTFKPAVEEEFGKENVIAVKHAVGGTPIRRWYRNWKPLNGDEPKAKPDLYEVLLDEVNKAVANTDIATVTFIWMQGERDAREELAEVYERSLLGLYEQVKSDLNIEEMNFIIGRLSDFDMKDEKYPHWTKIRNIQVKVAESELHFAWIDTDDLNDGFNKKGKPIANDLHMSVEGYKTMGQRFADEAIELIKTN
nr:sialate O-acetylesterase [Allomuricauda sp.]